MKSARMAALEVLYQVDHEAAYSNIALNRVLEKYQPEKKDRGFITELVYGTLKRINTLDWILGQFLNRPLDSLTPWIRNILRMGVYQLFYLDRVPESAACNESTNLAKRYGHQGTVKFVNGVLRNIARRKSEVKWPDMAKEPVSYLAITYAHPEWLVKMWMDDYGFAETELLLQANNQVPPNAVRTNTLRISREDLSERLTSEGVACEPGVFAPETLIISGFHSIGSIAAHREGLFLVQDESSTVVGHILKPQPGSQVIDACSAPGGKTTHLAQLMKNQGIIRAFDIHPHKIELIEENAAKLGISIIKPEVEDATKIGQKLCEWADYVLVDAPCSGLGVLRRRPELRWRKVVDRFAELNALQFEILLSAASTVKKGGVMVYSTCTINKKENAEMVQRFLEARPEFTLEDLRPLLPEGDALTKFPTAGEGFIQFLPHVHGTDGFFMARMRRKTV